MDFAMQSLSMTSGAFALPKIVGSVMKARLGRVVLAETEAAGVEPRTRGWRLRRGCGATFEVYDTQGAYLGLLVAPSNSAAAEFAGGTIYLDRTHLILTRRS